MIELRSTPTTLSGDDARAMIIKKGFYHSSLNKTGKGLPNNYEALARGKVILDSSTGLMWQQSGSSECMEYEKAQEYITQLNREKFAGYLHWRLPTLEEAMSLMKPVKYISLYHLAPDFDENQSSMWTADRPRYENIFALYEDHFDDTSAAWHVSFLNGTVGYGSRFGDVRAVRSAQSS